ncbi:MAG: class I SAM-dependent methyltransferase [Halobacteriota archaeon]
MQQDKVKVRLGGVSGTLLFPLWGRAQLSKEYSSLFYDAKAIELVERIDYDFSASDMPFVGIMFNISRKGNLLPVFSLVALMAKQFDDKIKTYITEHPHASVVNIGSGLDATFYRIDNGTIHWYDLDLPAVIDVRKQLLPEPDRVTYIAKSLLDPSWCDDIEHTEDGVFIIAGEVLQFFEEAQVKQFFSMLADNFPDGEIVFTAMSRSDEGFREWMDMFPPEQRDAMRAAWMEALKDWWEKAPQDQKDEAITALKTPTKPKGTEWSDLEAWWNQLSDTEKAGALRDLMAAFSHIPSGGVGMWTLEDANEITKWDNRITVIDRLSLFKNIPRDSLSADMRRLMDYFDESGGLNIFHLRV